jgi:ankyrin repeat protein
MNANVLDSLHWTPLHCAVHYSCLAVVKALDVNVQDKLGTMPLHHAISDSQADIAQVLLQHPSIQLNSQDKSG